MDVFNEGKFQGSKFSLLLFLAGIYSSISVCASLVQEKLLKDAPSLMIANVINYRYVAFLIASHCAGSCDCVMKVQPNWLKVSQMHLHVAHSSL